MIGKWSIRINGFRSALFVELRIFEIRLDKVKDLHVVDSSFSMLDVEIASPPFPYFVLVVLKLNKHGS